MSRPTRRGCAGGNVQDTNARATGGAGAARTLPARRNVAPFRARCNGRDAQGGRVTVKPRGALSDAATPHGAAGPCQPNGGWLGCTARRRSGAESRAPLPWTRSAAQRRAKERRACATVGGAASAAARDHGRCGGKLAGMGGGQQKQCHSFCFEGGAGATFAREESAAPRETPAANGVTARRAGETNVKK